MTSSQAIVSKKLHSPEYNEKYKTELCRNWQNGFCSFNGKCVFAHGKEELREKNLATSDEKSIQASDLAHKSPSPLATKKRLPVFVELSKRLSYEND
ncbi:hypothetical protein SteCoe_40036 [Stentor coeruleus]|uniref:C3H1-type domain-containing protein n=1 Tax=Stentor coeruleus TaxID=5963 RepID=A0A1R2AKH3_9CILI|nr:hypothetical protein SteCoe_40036 [Stentor coeruleus]